ncbi:hypothetical protein [Burkholderia ambifaria]|jgi:hypothetical protein|uniref:hypothetical protein n=1 Tax=Burkholderia ambifaria TaxID=152480 RepID=UPI001BA40F07|nr:hypothetical protein [Burkholderia ambifaria]MBR8179877.1 hypothetical protein [Burkholderia ambifaria]
MAATIKRRTWIDRYRSPLDGKMKQIKLGEWPALPFAAAIAAWEEQCRIRSSGLDVALNRKLERQRLLEQQFEASRPPYTVRMACPDYYNEHIRKARKTKGAELVKYMFEQRTFCLSLHARKNINLLFPVCGVVSVRRFSAHHLASVHEVMVIATSPSRCE